MEIENYIRLMLDTNLEYPLIFNLGGMILFQDRKIFT